MSSRPMSQRVEGLAVGTDPLLPCPIVSGGISGDSGLLSLHGLLLDGSSFFSCTQSNTPHSLATMEVAEAELMDAEREARLLASTAVPRGGGCRLRSSSKCLCRQQPALTAPGPADPHRDRG